MVFGSLVRDTFSASFAAYITTDCSATCCVCWLPFCLCRQVSVVPFAPFSCASDGSDTRTTTNGVGQLTSGACAAPAAIDRIESKVVLTGAKSVEQLEAGFKAVYPLLQKFKKATVLLQTSASASTEPYLGLEPARKKSRA